jgi:hypothetical protein
MAQTKKAYDEVRIPFSKMTFSPDVPSTALGANEYNVGKNIETDVRGIRSISGDEEISITVPGGETPIYISGGFRRNDLFYYVIATVEGKWYAIAGAGTWYDITPVNVASGGYSRAQNITEAWNGTVPFFNDEKNPPMFWPEEVNLQTTGASSSAGTSTLTFEELPKPPFNAGDIITVTGVVPVGFNGTKTVTACTTTSVSFAGSTAGTQTVAGRITSQFPRMIMYSNTLPAGIKTITYISATEQQITFDTPFAITPYVANDDIVISNVNNFFNGTFNVVSCTTTTVNYTASPGAAYPGGSVGSVAPLYCWNYTPGVKSYYAKFMRLYNTPNVGNILVAGNLTYTYDDNSIEVFPTTVQWSQNFKLSDAPITWEPTVLNVANALEMPLRGEAIDAWPCNGNLFIQSYWDTVVLSPINYTTTNTPILGVRLYNQGRGMITSNCWGNTDKMVYGLDARDMWQFDGQNFTGIGNQRVKNYLFSLINPLYVDRTFMQVNTQKNQIEIYYAGTQPTVGAVVATATSGKFTCELPFTEILAVGQTVIITGTNTGTGSITGYSSGNTYYIIAVEGNPITGKLDTFYLSTAPNGSPVATTAGTLTGLTFTITTVGVPNQMISYRYDLDVWNPPRDVNQAAFACESPVRAYNSTTGLWTFDKASRTIVYIRGLANTRPVQMNQSYSFINSSPIFSTWRRDNIHLIEDYSGKVMVHRVLPEVVNLKSDGLPILPGTTSLEGSINLQVEGSNSVAQPVQDLNSEQLIINTNNPWIQINQNSHRVIALAIDDISNDTIWMCSATTWQYTQVEDDR